MKSEDSASRSGTFQQDGSLLSQLVDSVKQQLLLLKDKPLCSLHQLPASLSKSFQFQQAYTLVFVVLSVRFRSADGVQIYKI